MQNCCLVQLAAAAGQDGASDRQKTQCCAQGARMSSRADRDRAKEALLSEASIVAATLSFAGTLATLRNHFDAVIIDEAAQAVEPSTLIPLVAGCRQVRLTGALRRPSCARSQAGMWHRDKTCEPATCLLTGMCVAWHPLCSCLLRSLPNSAPVVLRPKLLVRRSSWWVTPCSCQPPSFPTVQWPLATTCPCSSACRALASLSACWTSRRALFSRQAHASAWSQLTGQ